MVSNKVRTGNYSCKVQYPENSISRYCLSPRELVLQKMLTRGFPDNMLVLNSQPLEIRRWLDEGLKDECLAAYEEDRYYYGAELDVIHGAPIPNAGGSIVYYIKF